MHLFELGEDPPNISAGQEWPSTCLGLLCIGMLPSERGSVCSHHYLIIVQSGIVDALRHNNAIDDRKMLVSLFTLRNLHDTEHWIARARLGLPFPVA